jgi:NAD(P)-dependent dehydrogenase (short-subunit alcohol dehydrogenase family)
MGTRLQGKVAVVTGGANGIGEAIVRRFVEEGARVIIADLQVVPGNALAAELGAEHARFVETNVTIEDHIAAAVDLAVSTFGSLDIMCNNAGIVGAIGPIAATPASAWHTSVAILLNGVFYGMKHAARVMTPQKSGVIISTSSTAGIQGGLGPHAYTACKHAVIGLTKSCAAELGQHGIRVNAVAPGSVVTAMTAAVTTGDHTDFESAAKSMASRSPLGIAGSALDIANAFLYLASDEARNTSGHCLVVDAGTTTNGGSQRFHNSAPAILGTAGSNTPV